MATLMLNNYKWEEIKTNNSCVTYSCMVSRGYKMIVWALAARIDNGDGGDGGKHICEQDDSLGYDIVFIPQDKEAVDFRNWNETHTACTAFKLRMGDHLFMPTAEELFVLLEIVDAERVHGNAFKTITKTSTRCICPACNGTKVIDTGFYKRTCMDCYEE